MRVLIPATSGGHLKEALLLFEDLIAQADETVVLTNPGGGSAKLPYRCVYHQQTGPVVSVLLKGFALSLRLLWRDRPDWVVTTGAEVAVFSLLAARLFGIRTVFVETVTRRDNPTRAARICYYLAHHFYVQHPETLNHFGPKAQYIGGLI